MQATDTRSRPAGRPKGTGVGRTRKLRVNLTATEESKLKKLARAADQNVSDYVRARLFAA